MIRTFIDGFGDCEFTINLIVCIYGGNWKNWTSINRLTADSFTIKLSSHDGGKLEESNFYLHVISVWCFAIKLSSPSEIVLLAISRSFKIADFALNLAENAWWIYILAILFKTIIAWL